MVQLARWLSCVHLPPSPQSLARAFPRSLVLYSFIVFFLFGYSPWITSAVRLETIAHCPTATSAPIPNSSLQPVGTFSFTALALGARRAQEEWRRGMWLEASELWEFWNPFSSYSELSSPRLRAQQRFESECISPYGWLPKAYWYFSRCRTPPGWFCSCLISLTFLSTLTSVSCLQQEWIVQALVRAWLQPCSHLTR